MAAKNFTLGVDIGTTSVKVCVLDLATKEVLSKQSKDTQANVPSDQGSEGNKQDVPKIISALHSCMSRLPKELLRNVKAIGVCGQMHGVMLWSSNTDNLAWERLENSGLNPGVKLEVIRDKVSNLYTWQDTRCDPTFLSTLPEPNSHTKAYSGYGSATLFWFAKYRPDKLSRYNCCGTIQDFTVALLCNLVQPVMSVQTAASWGYFNSNTNTWNKSILETSGFPVQLLPAVVEARNKIGVLPDTWFGIPSGTPVGAALGDFQCSVLATLNPEVSEEAALNISTSAQLAYLMEDSFKPCDIPPEPATPIDYFPYFNGRYLAVAASLNGGNALAAFVKMLQHWTLELGFSVPQSKVWEKLIDFGNRDNAKSTLHIIPTLLGERHCPEQNASVANLDPGNLGLGQVFQALCSGVVQNLHSMIPREQLRSAEIKKIIGSGSALIRNQVLQKQVQEWYELPVEFVSGRGACVGAALAVLPHVTH